MYRSNIECTENNTEYREVIQNLQKIIQNIEK
jgi:hypothetical protein